MKQMKSFLAFITIVSILLSLIVVVPSVSASAENLALNCQVTATEELPGYPITQVKDGVTSHTATAGKTGITKFNSTGYGYFELSFSQETTVNFVKLYFNQVEANQRPRDIAVDVKRKDGVYIRVAEMHNIDYDIVSSTKYGRNNQFDFIFEEIECVSVRVTGNRQRTRDVNNSQSSNYNFRLMEIELFNKSDVTEEDYTGTVADSQAKYNIPVPEPVLDNIFAGMEVSSPLQLSNYSVSRLTDGNKLLSSDCSITSFNAANISYSEIILNEETELNQVRLYFNTYGPKERPKDIAIDVRLKNGVYVRVAEMHNIDYQISSNTVSVNTLDFKFEKLKGVAVRISANRQRTRDYYNEPNASYNFRLVEVEGYLNPTLVEEDYTGTTAATEDKYNIPVPEPVLDNLFADMEVSSPLQYSNYSVSRLTDGNKLLSSDCSITSFNAANISYSEIILNEETELNQVRLYFNTYGPKERPKDIAIDVRLKNGVYVRVAEMHNIDYQISSDTVSVNTLNFKFEKLKGVAVRISANRQRTRDYYNEPTASYNFRLVEVEGYLNPTLVEEDYTGTTAATEEKYNISVPDPILENLALNQTVISNKELTVEDKNTNTSVTYFASNLNDGNKGYSAGTETNAITQWNTAKTAYFEVQFKETTKINRLGVFLTTWEKESLPKDLAVDVQLANGVYIRVAEMHNINYDTKENLVFSFGEVDAIAVRITGNCKRNASSKNFRLVELEVYYYPNMPEDLFTGTVKDENDLYNIPVPDPVLINVALDKDVAANEVLSAKDEKTNKTVTYFASNLTDGNSNYSAETEFNAITKWNNTTKMGYFEVELGEKILINRIKVFLTKWQRESLPLDIAIDVRLESGVYVRVAEMHNIDYSGKETLTFSFDGVEAVSFRVTGNYARNGSSENFRLMELEAYYYPDMPAEFITGTTKDAEEKYNIPVPDPVLDNLAAGKKVIANETLKVKDVTYDANFLTDGNSNYFAGTEKNAITNWNKSTKMGYFEVELGEKTKFNRVAVFLTQWQKESLPKEMAIDVRLENGTYKRVAEMHNINYTDVKQLTFSFEDVEAVSFRVTGNYARNEKSENFRLMELEAYYYPNMPKELITGTTKDAEEKYNIPVPEPVLDNLAAGKKVTANETLVVEKFVYDANFLTDGNSNYFAGTEKNAITRYNGSTDCAWYEVDFGGKIKINRVAAFLAQWQKEFLPKDVAIDVRLENGTYKRVAEMHNINYKDVKQLMFSFEDVEVVAFRITGKRTRNEKSDNFRLMELEAYYYPDMPEEKLTGTTKDEDDKYNIEVPDPMLENLALGMQASANDELKANDVLYSASRLTDGFSKYNCDSATDYTAITRWIDGKKLGWFEISFEEATLFNQVKLCLTHWEKEYLPLDIAIDAKLENGEYVRVAEMHDIDYNGKQELVFYFQEQKAVSFRVVGNANRNKKSFNFRLVETEAYYWPGMPEEKYTGTTKDENPLYNMSNEDLIVSEKDKDTGSTDKKPISSTGVSLGSGLMQNNMTEQDDNKFELSTMEYVILFVLAAGFVVLTFMGGSSFVAIFTSYKLKKSNKTQSIN